MDSYDVWDQRVAQEADRLALNEGYKILYVPWSTIGEADTAFLSLNPGRPPQNADLQTLSDERGNSYEIEKDVTASPITAQFLALAEMLDRRPREILTGVVAPFRSNRWKGLELYQRRGALSLGKKFWQQVFSLKLPKRVIACCPEAVELTKEILGAKLETSLASGWGKTMLHRYRAKNGALIAQIPHLSTFKLLSRPQCHGPLREILELT
ncbi:hypothetical protein [Oceanicola granulosus]|uniref:hypothetical protein n=1 Tax=Oceanicola granulosus TaxID=252302 RepID=UPI0012E9BF60|nr:hypothetical protein [Oceanicola granulosus]